MQQVKVNIGDKNIIIDEIMHAIMVMFNEIMHQAIIDTIMNISLLCSI